MHLSLTPSRSMCVWSYVCAFASVNSFVVYICDADLVGGWTSIKSFLRICASDDYLLVWFYVKFKIILKLICPQQPNPIYTLYTYIYAAHDTQHRLGILSMGKKWKLNKTEI